MKPMPRIVNQIDKEGLASFLDFIFEIIEQQHFPLSQRVDAFVIFPGMGEPWRLNYPNEIMHDLAIKAKYLLVAGYNSSEVESFFNTDKLREEYNDLFQINNISIEKPSKDKSSKTQTLWVAGKIKELGIKDLMLCLPPYHLVRAFLTLLQTCEKKRIKETLIFPHAIPISMGEKIPMLIGGIFYKQIDLLWAEIKRITVYQAKGDVASYETGKEYLARLVKALGY